jgi:hypothetical protein
MPPTTRSGYQKNKNTLKKKPYDKPSPKNTQTNPKEKSESDANKLTGGDNLNEILNMVNMVNEIECDDPPSPTPLTDEDLDTVLKMVDEIECDKSHIRNNTPERSSKNGDGTIRITTDSSLPPQSIPVQNKPFQLIGPSHISQEMLKMARSYWESIPQMTHSTIQSFKNRLFPEANNTIS